MHLDTDNLNELGEVACVAAREAGRVIRTFTAGEVEVLHKEGGDSLASQVVTEVDERSQAAVLECLQPTMEAYDLGLLTEEMSDDGSRFEKDYFWCIDPLDGTLPFTQGKPGYAVSIALIRRDGQAMIGVAYDPVEDRLYCAVSGLGLTINGQPWKMQAVENHAEQTLRFCMDFTFETDERRRELSAQLEALALKMGYAGAIIDIRGGAVCNACYVLEHPPAIYLKEPKAQEGGGSFWDFAATVCIFQQAGAAVTDSFGKALELNSSTHTFFNHCGVCYCSDPALAESVFAHLR